MFVSIILSTVLVPLLLGIVLYGVLRVFPKIDPLVALITGAMAFAIYVILESMPSLPPISSKDKVALLIALFTVAAIVTSAIKFNRFVTIVILLVGALVWLGWNRLYDPEMLPRFATLLVPILIGGWAFQKFDWQDQPGLVWPVTLLCFAIGGAVVALLGAYIGFAQMLGAFAAFAGGFALVFYLLLLFAPQITPISLPQSALQIVFLSMMAVLLATGLFAPEISPAALALLGLVLFAPFLQARFGGYHSALKPIITGVIAAIPALAAIAVASL